jgi:IS30 family transposase
MPKGTDLSTHSAQDLDRIARSLNDRPRKALGFMSPSEKLAEVLALTG